MVLKPEPLAEALESLGILAKAELGAGVPTHGDETAMNGAQTSQGEKQVLRDTEENRVAQDDSRVRNMTRVILLSAQGRPFTQAVARDLGKQERVVLICGRYEGVDERINELYCDMELSIGDYVLSGGELAAAVVVDTVMRLVPGVLGNEASGEFESFGIADAEISSDEDGVPRSQHGAGGLLDYPHFTRPAEFGGLRAPEVLMNGDHQQIRRWRREQQLRKTLKNRPDLLEGAALSDEDQKLLDAIAREDGE
jgi:tRNA (guanine37-N1)-methyltransferase